MFLLACILRKPEWESHAIQIPQQASDSKAMLWTLISGIKIASKKEEKGSRKDQDFVNQEGSISSLIMWAYSEPQSAQYSYPV
jgi:hypothetical protein